MPWKKFSARTQEIGLAVFRQWRGRMGEGRSKVRRVSTSRALRDAQDSTKQERKWSIPTSEEHRPRAWGCWYVPIQGNIGYQWSSDLNHPLLWVYTLSTFYPSQSHPGCQGLSFYPISNNSKREHNKWIHALLHILLIFMYP